MYLVLGIRYQVFGIRYGYREIFSGFYISLYEYI